jgi:hypothetical protein
MIEGQETVTVEGSFQPRDYWRANRYGQNRSPRIWLVRAFLLAMPWLILVYQYRSDPDNWTWWVLLVPLFVGGVVLFIMPLIDRAFLERRIQSIPAAFSPQSYAFSDAGMEIDGQNKHVELRWGAIIKAVESSQDFFFFVGSSMAHFIPKRFLSSAKQEAQLRKILRRNLGEKAALAKQKS